MKVEKIDQSLTSLWRMYPDRTSRVIIRVSQELDQDRVDFLRSLGATGALVETVLISTTLNQNAIEALSEKDWVLSIEVPSGGQFYDPY